MATAKPSSGDLLPPISLPTVSGGAMPVTQPPGGDRWRMLVVYRGKHCPICKGYLSSLEALIPRFAEIGIDVVALSGDPQAKAEAQAAEGALTFPIAYGLSVEQMRSLGLYVSEPRSPQETDRPFPEPGLFVVRSDGRTQIIDISNAPFARPDLNSILSGLSFVRKNDYPIRGTLG